MLYLEATLGITCAESLCCNCIVEMRILGAPSYNSLLTPHENLEGWREINLWRGDEMRRWMKMEHEMESNKSCFGEWNWYSPKERKRCIISLIKHQNVSQGRKVIRFQLSSSVLPPSLSLCSKLNHLSLPSINVCSSFEKKNEQLRDEWRGGTGN